MLKWEYRRVEALYESKSKSWKVGGTTERDFLNSMGRDGWDLVSHHDGVVVDQVGRVTENWHSYMFKRPVE